MYLDTEKGKNADNTFEMRNYGNKGLVVGERCVLLTVDDYRSPTAKRKAHSIFFVMRMMMMMMMMMTLTMTMTMEMMMMFMPMMINFSPRNDELEN